MKKKKKQIPSFPSCLNIFQQLTVIISIMPQLRTPISIEKVCELISKAIFSQFKNSNAFIY